MADWKLLGEVPDSEDEDAFDSQELATGLDSTTTHPDAIPEIDHQETWEFFGSQKAAEPVHKLPSPNGSLSSSLLSSAQSVDGLPELDAMFLEGKELGSRLENLGGGPNDLDSLRTYIDSENHAPTTLADLSRSSSPNIAVNEDVALPSPDLGLLKNAHDLQRESVRLERSLRPRKPIQEHPYLLENARYSSLIRQHGMRPVKIAVAGARAARDEIPQDGEFRDDSQGNSLPDLSNSSQLLPGNDTDESGDFGIYNIPSSSPLRTSPWLNHRRSSNHESSQGDTDNTSVADQDLPALHELLPNSQQQISPSTKRPNTTSGSSARKRRRHDIVDSDPMDVDSRGQDAPAASDKRLAAGPLPPIPRLQPSVRRSVVVSPTKTVVTIVDSSSSEAEEHEEEETRERQGSITDESANERLDYKRRIRGVLPASWLRLDQKASRDKAQKNLHIRQRNRTPEKEKKFLDSIYLKNNRESSVDASDVRTEVSTVRLSTASLPKIGQDDFERRKQAEKHRVRLKKARKPVRVDVDAPQYSHAADPLPGSFPFEIEQTRPQTANAEAKLAGLGPYGTVCHYLVRQWGWRRSGSIIGVIFDFFGSQNLEHLRNEEANASPRFLEQLAGEPSLAIEPGDKCFHIFLKLLALSIQKLRAVDAIKDIRNLVARIIPNHNRQYLKEQTVHERDLAALRNHHDLLATLFWAAPPELRPSPALIERLVAPETSHKEASLINIRCWSQIARFIVAKGEASTAFKPFHLWRNNLFQKMVQQFDSAAADIHQQLLALPSEARHTISEDVISSMVLMNKEAIGDVLQASITASLNVMKHAAHLEAATFCLNTLQLQHIYKQFGVWPPELNWKTLRGAISTLDLFVDYIAEFKENEESQQSESHILDSVQGDDALLLLDHEISERCFSMVRCILLNGTSSHGRAVSSNFGGIEQGVAVAARLAACFIKGGLVKLHELFKRGKFGLFDGPIQKLDFYQRQYFVLVVVTLLKADIDDFTDAGFTLCELWLLLLVRPNRYLKYQSQLAEKLRERGEYFLPSADDGLTSSPDYECNETLFEFAISTMRRSIRDAAPNLGRVLTAVHSKALKLVMEQMKEDLKATSSQPVAHVAYVAFARRIISLIRTHGSEIRSPDNFYYQISKDYSPSVEDPRLQIAAMVSYGLRLREGDPNVVQQLFFFLFNNFKMALISDSLDEEKKMLQKGMAQDRGITQFVLGKMLPAIIEATATKSAAYPFLDLYVWAARNRLKRSTTTYCLTDAELPGVKSFLQTILNGVDAWIAEQAQLTDVRLHTLQSFFAGFNLLWPSIYEYSLNQDISSGPWSEITELISTLGQYVISSKDSLCQGRFWNSPQRFNEFFAAVAADSARTRGMADLDVEGFVDNIKQDVDRNWYEADGRISIQTPGKSRGGGALQGVLQARWGTATLIAGIKVQFMEWLHWKKKLDGGFYPMEREDFERRLF
ncbi:hypothetical protein NHJ13734_003397 [Beauveria thailandica]